MPTVDVAFDAPLQPHHAADLGRQIHYLDEGIEAFEFTDGPTGVTGVRLTLSPCAASEEALSARVRTLLSTDVARLRALPQRVIWSDSAPAPPAGDVYAALASQGAVSHAGPGLAAVGEPMLGLIRALDERVISLVRDSFPVREYAYPTLIPTEVVARCGYFDSFPQFMMFVTRLHTDTDTYAEFRKAYTDADARPRWILDHSDDLSNCLPPTMCFHTYNQYWGSRLASDELLVVSSKGKAFRFESRYATGLDRLWDFTIREIVFFGSREAVLIARRTLLERTRELLGELGLASQCEVANDPFFTDPGRATRLASQVMRESKYELRLPVGDRTLATASFNYADTFFTERFDLAFDDGSRAHSGCVGFGLERLAYAFACQHGLSPGHWPAFLTR